MMMMILMTTIVAIFLASPPTKFVAAVAVVVVVGRADKHVHRCAVDLANSIIISSDVGSRRTTLWPSSLNEFFGNILSAKLVALTKSA